MNRFTITPQNEWRIFMKLYKVLVCVALLPFLLACDGHKDDAVECEVVISYLDQDYTAAERDDTKRKAHRDALEEACEIACKDVDSCERECVKSAVVKSSKCIDVYTKAEVK